MNIESILLVDDEPELLAVCREALLEQGHNVHVAGNGRQALDFLASQPVSLVVTDLSMPQLDGVGLLRGIVDRHIDTDVIFLTGYGTIENAVECLRMGARDYLLKPFDVRKLLATVGKALDERRNRKVVDSPDHLQRLFALNGILSRQDDLRSLVKEFLALVRADFDPDCLALYLTDTNSQALRPGVYWGSRFASNPALKKGFVGIAQKTLTESYCKVVPLGSGSNQTVLAAPILSGPFRTGALLLTRDAHKPAYTKYDATLLSVYAAHAASAIEGIRANRRISGMNMQVITSYVRAVEAKDLYTCGHMERVSAYAVLLGQQLGLQNPELEQLRIAGMLHDIGKIGIPDSILNKPSGLTDDEFSVMKRHPEVAENILAHIEPLKDVLPIIYHHHERFDGRGYPGGLKGQDIPYLARVISVVDGFEAMTSDRAYHKARSADQAMNILNSGAGEQWDPQLVNAWQQCVATHGLQLAGATQLALTGTS